MSKGIRNLVSKRKRRFKENGYDLDLSCILWNKQEMHVIWRSCALLSHSSSGSVWILSVFPSHGLLLIGVVVKCGDLCVQWCACVTDKREWSAVKRRRRERCVSGRRSSCWCGRGQKLKIRCSVLSFLCLLPRGRVWRRCSMVHPHSLPKEHRPSLYIILCFCYMISPCSLPSFMFILASPTLPSSPILKGGALLTCDN